MIIAVLMGLAFPVFQGVQNQARRTQARNDLMQIVTAVNAYYAEYGKYPLTPATPADTTYGADANERAVVQRTSFRQRPCKIQGELSFCLRRT